MKLLKILWVCWLVGCYGCSHHQERHGKEKADSINQAQVNEAAQMGTTTSFDETDAAFVVEAVHSSMEQIGISNLIEQRASEELIKTFGKDISADFTQVQKALTHFAQIEHIAVPTTLSKESNQLLNELSNKSGITFDDAFAKIETEILQKNYQRFDQAKNAVQHAALKKIIENTLPIIKDRLSYVKALDEQLNKHELKGLP